MDLIESHDWPGNVRELFNILETAALIEPEGDTITDQSIRVAFRSAFASPVAEYGFPMPAGFLNGEHGDLSEMLEAVERALLREALARTQGVQTEAAKLLGIGAKNLWKKLRKYSIEARDWVAESQDLSSLKQMVASANVLPFRRQSGAAKPAGKSRKKA
jgi:DNA-binding NtrC family response regulator